MGGIGDRGKDIQMVFLQKLVAKPLSEVSKKREAKKENPKCRRTNPVRGRKAEDGSGDQQHIIGRLHAADGRPRAEARRFLLTTLESSFQKQALGERGGVLEENTAVVKTNSNSSVCEIT